MKEVEREITKEEYEQAQEEGADILISPALFFGYGVTGARVYERDGKYYLTYRCGSSCD